MGEILISFEVNDDPAFIFLSGKEFGNITFADRAGTIDRTNPRSRESTLCSASRFVSCRIVVSRGKEYCPVTIPSYPTTEISSGTRLPISLSDVMALGAIRAFSDMGKRVPEDISVVGYDGIVTGQYSLPRLTTIRQDTKRLAEQSVDSLLRGFVRSGHPVHGVVPFQMVPGESVARIG